MAALAYFSWLSDLPKPQRETDGLSNNFTICRFFYSGLVLFFNQAMVLCQLCIHKLVFIMYTFLAVRPWPAPVQPLHIMYIGFILLSCCLPFVFYQTKQENTTRYSFLRLSLVRKIGSWVYIQGYFERHSQIFKFMSAIGGILYVHPIEHMYFISIKWNEK